MKFVIIGLAIIIVCFLLLKYWYELKDKRKNIIIKGILGILGVIFAVIMILLID